MEKQRQKHLASLMFILITAMIPVLGSHTAAGKYYYISIIAAGILFFPFLLIVLRVANLSRNYENVFEYVGQKNSFFGRAFAGSYGLYALITAITSLRIIGEEIKLTTLFNTPFIVLFLFMVGLHLYILCKKPNVLWHFSALYAPILIVFVIGYVLLSINQYEFGNFEPVFRSSIGSISGSMAGSITGFYGDAVLILFASGLKGNNQKEPIRKRYFIIAYIAAFFCLTATVLNSLLVIGGEALNKLYFPHYVTVSLINVGIVARLETLVDIIYFIAINIKIAFSIYCVVQGFGYCFFKNTNTLQTYTKYVNVGVCLLCVGCAAFAFGSTRDFFDYLEYYRYSGIIMIFALCRLWIATEIIARRGRISSVKEGKLSSKG